MNRRSRNAFLRFAAIVLVALPLAGCANQVDFGSYKSFDAWYAGGRADGLNVESIGITGMDGNFVGYLVDDVCIRTPVFVLYEVTWLVLLPVAIPYYTYVFVAGDDDAHTWTPPESPPSRYSNMYGGEATGEPKPKPGESEPKPVDPEPKPVDPVPDPVKPEAAETNA